MVGTTLKNISIGTIIVKQPDRISNRLSIGVVIQIRESKHPSKLQFEPLYVVRWTDTLLDMNYYRYHLEPFVVDNDH